MSLIEANEYTAIRSAIDATYTDSMLPDSLIEEPIYLPAAEAEVTRQDPDAATRTGDEKTLIQLAVIYFTASLLVPVLPPIQSSSVETSTYGRREDNQVTFAQYLWAKGQEALDLLLSPSATAVSRPTTFTVATGTRGL